MTENTTLWTYNNKLWSNHFGPLPKNEIQIPVGWRLPYFWEILSLTDLETKAILSIKFQFIEDHPLWCYDLTRAGARSYIYYCGSALLVKNSEPYYAVFVKDVPCYKDVMVSVDWLKTKTLSEIADMLKS